MIISCRARSSGLRSAWRGLALARQSRCPEKHLSRIGGFETVANQLADDYAIGKAVRQAGLRVVLPPMLVAHSFEEKSLSEVVRHELRWARTIFTVDPVGYIGSGVTHALPLSLIGAALRGFDALGLAAVLGALACRLFLKYRLTREFDLPNPELCSPFRPRHSLVRDLFWQFLVNARQLGADRISRSRGTERCWRRLSREVGLGVAVWKGDEVMRTLFLQAPSFDGFDGGAGSRYQSKREIRSFWYPTWLAQPAALVENSKLIDAPPHGTSLAEVVAEARNFDLAVLHTSTPSFASDVKAIAALKAANPALKAGLIGAKAAVDAEGTLKAAPIVDFAARNEFDFTIKEVADGKDWKSIRGLSFRDANGEIQHTPDRPSWKPWTTCPSSRRSISAICKSPDISSAISVTPIFFVHRTRLQIAVHVLPVAAKRWRSSLPHPQRRPCHRGNRLGEEGVSGGQGILFRRRHVHRRFAAGRGDRAGTWQAWRRLVLQRQGQRAPRRAESYARQRLASAAGRL